MNSKRILRNICILMGVLGLPGSAAAVSFGPGGSSSEFRQESNGLWLYVDGVKTPALAGMVYQNTEGNNHVRTYEYGNSIHSLYSALDEPGAGGQGHGARLARMGIQAIRVYELPVENEDDANHTKDIFRRLYSKYKIKVLIGDWAGLQSGYNLSDPASRARIFTHVQKLVATYAEEAWVLGWQVGNENNYHTRNGILGQEIALDPPAYYAFMDDLAGAMKDQLGRQHLKQFIALGQGELTEADAQMISSLKNFDAIGINCYRKDAHDFEDLINLASSKLRVPIYFAEIGLPANDPATAKNQAQYLENVEAMIFSHGPGCLRSGNVEGAFIHEATDELWKRSDRGKEADAHFGILGKSSEEELGHFINQYRDFCTYIIPTNDAPDTLIQSAWQCLTGPYPRQHVRAYGFALGYANRAITLYQDKARQQQDELINAHAPPNAAASADYWALNTVGTGYFIMAARWMLQSYDYKGTERVSGWWPRLRKMTDFDQSLYVVPVERSDVEATNSEGCIYFARQVCASLYRQYPNAQLREPNGHYRPLAEAVETRFPELSQPYLPLSWQNCVRFTSIGLAIMLGIGGLTGWRASKSTVQTVRVMGGGMRFAFLLALIFNLVCLFWLINWWFHPVRLRFFTVQPVLYWMLSAIGAVGVLFYFFVWFLLWNMRRPVPMNAPPGYRVAIVTTRVASEPIDQLEETLMKMAAVTYPHDSYLLDEENSAAAKTCCEHCGVIHFSRKGRPEYNQPVGRFQERTKGGNLNSWLYEFGGNYDFVTFLDPDHGPKPEFLDKVLGYFQNPKVAFVQAPQVFYNANTNWIARGAAEQNYFFSGPIQMGLFGVATCVVNGSHSTFRISDLLALPENAYAVHDADDVLTSMRIHGIKKTGVYVPEILAEGLAPDNWEEFSKQQRRWASSMFHLLFHYYPKELRRLPWRSKLVYLSFTAYYFRGVAFVGLLLLPFISAITGNPPVNANVTAFCCRYLPFLFMQYAILLLLGQRYLIPGSGKGIWFRGGMLWVAMWWGHLCALARALRSKRVRARVVASKWKATAPSPWRALRPHLVLTIAAISTFAWACSSPARRETVWGSLFFLGVIIASQGGIIFKVIHTSAKPVPRPEPVHQPRTVTVPA